MRKKPHEEHVNSEGWAVPYADLLTLLLAFFVVMYSLSQINQSKYRVLAEALNQAFNGTGKVVQPMTPAEPARQVPLPDKAHAANATPIAMIPVPIPPQHLPLPGHEGAASKPSPGTDIQMAHTNPRTGAVTSEDSPPATSAGVEVEDLKTISADVAKALEPWVERKQVIIRQTKLWLEIEIRTDVLFPSGVAKLTGPARTVLEGVAGVLARFPNPIRIEGYTDNRPIDTWKFPSNWELSAARAGSVARLLAGHGVDPDRMGIFGWGEYHPVASNATPEGRNENRRIAIVVLSDQGVPQHFYHNGSDSYAITPTPATSPSPAPAKTRAGPHADDSVSTAATAPARGTTTAASVPPALAPRGTR
ncbi:MAG TPA: flagellar motor protein MotD [Rhodanobacteraceae bacterium]|nr:flagellar motor protein MotD [Rhodanobacteraceae bacterium]